MIVVRAAGYTQFRCRAVSGAPRLASDAVSKHSRSPSTRPDRYSGINLMKEFNFKISHIVSGLAIQCERQKKSEQQKTFHG